MDSPSSSPERFDGAAPQGGAEPWARRGAANDAPTLRIEGVSSGYGGIPIVRDREAGLTVLLVEQNVDLVYLAADRCGVMNKGSVETWLDPDSLADERAVRRYLALRSA